MNVSNLSRRGISVMLPALAILFAAAYSLRAQPIRIDSATVIVWYHPDTSMAAAIAAVVKIGGSVRDSSTYFHRLTVRIDSTKVPSIRSAPWCLWVSGPMRPEPHWEDGSRRAIGADISLPFPYGVASADAVTGAGVAVGIWDAGQPYPHADFGNRLHMMEAITGCAAESQKHYTHVAGIVGGDGLGTLRRWSGVAPGANLYAYNVFGPGSNANYCSVDDYFPEDEVVRAADIPGIVIAQNSWGVRPDNLAPCADFGTYSGWCADYDAVVRRAAVTVVFSAGNFRASCADYPCSPAAAAGYGLLMAPATAMNIITVGAVDQNGTPAYYSSWGPTRDGRLKPDIVAVGSGVFSTVPIGSSAPNGYDTLSGTSMACPMVSGAAALLVQKYRILSGGILRPDPALIKALLLNTADEADAPGPDYKTGFGRLNVWRALRALHENRFWVTNIDPGRVQRRTINVLQPVCSLKVMMVYSDPVSPNYNNGAPLANDLDLWLVGADGTTYRPLVLDPAHPSAPAVPGVDARNNVEQVVVVNPPPGTWEINVAGTQMNAGPQICAVTWEGNTDPMADLYMRDQDIPLDLGDEPNTNTGPMWESPDIWVRNAPDGVEHQHEHQNAVKGATNYVYVKVRNRGCSGADGTLHLYWSKSSMASTWPDHWNGNAGCNGAPWGGEIGPSQAVSMSGFGERIFRFEWAPPDPRLYESCGAQNTHFCLLARIETSSAYPYGMKIAEGSQTDVNVRNNNNIVQKNVTVLGTGPAGAVISGTVMVRRTDSLRASTSLIITMPKNEAGKTLFKIADSINLRLDPTSHEQWRGSGSGYSGMLPMNNGVFRQWADQSIINNILLSPSEEFPMDVTIWLPADAPPGQYTLRIEQLAFSDSTGIQRESRGGQTFMVVVNAGGRAGINRDPAAEVSGPALDVAPNPAAHTAAASFILAERAHVRLTITDLTGRELKVLVDGEREPGANRVEFSVDGVPSGFYFCAMTTASGTSTARFVVAR